MVFLLEFIFEFDIYGWIDNIFGCFCRYFFVLYGVFNSVFDVLFFDLLMESNLVVFVFCIFFGFMGCFVG